MGLLISPSNTNPDEKIRFQRYAARETGFCPLWASSDYRHPIHLPIPDILCQTFRMRNLTITLCLTIAVILGNGGEGEFELEKDLNDEFTFKVAFRFNHHLNDVDRVQSRSN